MAWALSGAAATNAAAPNAAEVFVRNTLLLLLDMLRVVFTFCAFICVGAMNAYVDVMHDAAAKDNLINFIVVCTIDIFAREVIICKDTCRKGESAVHTQ